MASFAAVELRRALLLFAIVLGVAAVVAALASPSRDDPIRTATTPPPEAATPPGSGRPPARVGLDGRRAPRHPRLEIGRATTLVVTVEEPGQVTIPELGLTEAAEPQRSRGIRDPACPAGSLPRCCSHPRAGYARVPWGSWSAVQPTS